MGVQVGFYHTAGDNPAAVDAVLPALLEKAVGGGSRIMLVAPTAARQQRLDEALWSYRDTAFLPHGKPEDGPPEEQPILIVNAEEPVAGFAAGRIPVVLAGAESVLEVLLAAGQGRVLYMFSAASADVERGRGLFKQLKAAGHEISYYLQGEKGWEKKL